jgi:putative oxidoreductase
VVRIAESGAPATNFLVRVALGVMFAQSGWGKLQNLERTAGFFDGLGIPAPGFHALLVGNVELAGGVLLAIGLLTRLVAIPLAITMVVAIFTAMLPDVEGVLDFITLDETLYFAILVWAATHGPGKWSLDEWIWKKFIIGKNAPPTNRSSLETEGHAARAS